LYNAYGAITDREERLRLVSPCSIEKMSNWKEDGTIFAELGTDRRWKFDYLIR
jgi:hypothetical protein